MKLIRLSLLSVFLLIFTISCEKSILDYPEEYEVISSVHELNEMYLLTVFLPNSLSMDNISDNEEMKNMQVLYVLDSDKNVESVARIVKELQIPIITVGVGYVSENRRNRDYTPTNWQFDDAGGASTFFEFMETDVFTYMETNYYVSADKNKRYILGWSLGGLAVIYSSLSNTDLFYGHIAISPSLMWDDQYIFSIEEENRLLNNRDTAYVGLYAGSHEFPGMIVAKNAYHERLKFHYPNVITDAKIFNNRAHTSVVEDAIYHALKACFIENH